MMLYRSLVVGLLLAIAMLVATLPGELRRATPTAAEPEEVPVLHVARAALTSPSSVGDTLGRLMGLAPGARVVALDGQPPARFRLPGTHGDALVEAVVARGPERALVHVVVHP